MQVELPRYVWADTRFRKDKADPLLFRALTKSYDPETHRVSPFVFDVNFTPAGVNPEIARSMIALCELGMLTLPGLISSVDGAEKRVADSGVKPRFRIFSNYFSELTGVSRGTLRQTGQLFGMLSGNYMRKFYERELNIYDILDAGCRKPELDLPGKFVDFYRGVRRTAVVKAEQLKPRFETPPPGIYVDTLVAELLTEADKGFLRSLERMGKFADVYTDSRNPRKIESLSDLSRQDRLDIFATYCSEIAVGIDFLKQRDVQTGHEKFLAHRHAVLQNIRGVTCLISTGDSDVRREVIQSSVADIEYAFRCPFFVEQGWVDTKVRSN